ncbi:MAG: hypothetical protein M3237_05200 [Actinomycetota bacterium]|nr:hypothetical protein [Actinomycetota bacterium]
MTFRTVLAGALLVILVIAGGVAWKGWDAMTGLDAPAGAKQELCSTLDNDERMALVGVETPKTLTNVEGALDRYTCRWATEDFETVAAFVEVVAAPADEWALEIKNTLATRPANQDPRPLIQLREAARNPLRTAADGCRFAWVLFEASGAPDGAKRVVAPSAFGAQGVPMMMAHSCLEGTYSAVLVTAPGLALDRSLARKTAQALRAVEKRLS